MVKVIVFANQFRQNHRKNRLTKVLVNPYRPNYLSFYQPSRSGQHLFWRRWSTFALTKLSRKTSKSFNTYPLIALAVNTGMRRGEIAALQWADIDLDNNCIHIKHAIMEIRGHCFLDTPKTESSLRTIYISSSMTDILRAHKKVATGKFVFPSITNLDKPMMPSRIYTLFSKVIDSVDIKCRFHTLRHTHITQLLENGVNIKTIQDRVGHTQISTTMGYCHPSKEKDQAAAAIFDQFIQ